MSLSADTAAGLSSTIIGLGILLSSLAQLSARRHLAEGGFFDWQVIRARVSWTREGAVARRLDRLFTYPPVLWIIAVQALSAAVLALHPSAALTLAALGVVLATQLLLRLRTQWGTDGADQITLIVLAGLFCFYLAPPGTLRTASLVFIAAETVLCYFAAGLSKLLDERWRSGMAIPVIVRSLEFGLAPVSARLDQNAGRLLCWSTILWEGSAPLFVLLGPGPCLVYLGLGFFFHVSVAVVMGLTDFVWAYAATYPAVLFLSDLIA